MAKLIMDISNMNVGRASRLPSAVGASPILLLQGRGRRDACPALRSMPSRSADISVCGFRRLSSRLSLPLRQKLGTGMSRQPADKNVCASSEREAPTSQPHRRAISVISTGARLFLVLMSLLLVSGCSKQARKERHLKQADQYFEAKDFKKAEIEYLNVFRGDRTNAWVVKRLATIYYDQGRMQQALPFLLGARELDKDNAEVRIQLAQLMLSARQYQDVRKEVIYVLDRFPTNDDAILLLSDSAATPKDIV